jgi:hypothetical protein
MNKEIRRNINDDNDIDARLSDRQIYRKKNLDRWYTDFLQLLNVYINIYMTGIDTMKEH